MSSFSNDIAAVSALRSEQSGAWSAINPESVARMRIQNRFKTGLDIAKYTADIMRADMAEYDTNPAAYTQSLGCWHGFIGQQKLISIKKHFGTTKKKIPLSLRLDGRRPTLRIRPPARSINA